MDDSTKNNFSGWAKNVSVEKFIGFKLLFETLKLLCA